MARRRLASSTLRAYTLIEVYIVLTALGIAAALALPVVVRAASPPKAPAPVACPRPS